MLTHGGLYDFDFSWQIQTFSLSKNGFCKMVWF